MATLEEILTAIEALPDTIAKAVVASLPPQPAVDPAALEAAITNGFAALTAEIKTNVEGTAPAPTPAPEPAPAA